MPSLVGSEMCIRDSPWGDVYHTPLGRLYTTPPWGGYISHPPGAVYITPPWGGVYHTPLGRCISHRPGAVYITPPWGGVYHTPLGGRCVSHPAGAVFQARLLCNQEGANTERYVFGKLSARCFRRRPLWHRHNSSCGDTEHGKSTQRGVIYSCRIRVVRAAVEVPRREMYDTHAA